MWAQVADEDTTTTHSYLRRQERLVKHYTKHVGEMGLMFAVGSVFSNYYTHPRVHSDISGLTVTDQLHICTCDISNSQLFYLYLVCGTRVCPDQAKL